MPVCVEEPLKPCLPYRIEWRRSVEARGDKIVALANRLKKRRKCRVAEVCSTERAEQIASVDKGCYAHQSPKKKNPAATGDDGDVCAIVACAQKACKTVCEPAFPLAEPLRQDGRLLHSSSVLPLSSWRPIQKGCVVTS